MFIDPENFFPLAVFVFADDRACDNGARQLISRGLGNDVGCEKLLATSFGEIAEEQYGCFGAEERFSGRLNIGRDRGFGGLRRGSGSGLGFGRRRLLIAAAHDQGKADRTKSG